MIFVISLSRKPLGAKSAFVIFDALMKLNVVNETALKLEYLTTALNGTLIRVAITHELHNFFGLPFLLFFI